MALSNPVTVSVHGLDVLERGLIEIGNAAAGKALGNALFAGAGTVRKEAKARAPVGSVPHYIGRKAKGRLVQPGNLRKQIRLKRVRDEKYSSVVIVTLGGDGFYGKFLEFGSAKVAARPFLRPAFDTKKEEALRRIQERLAANIEKARQKIYEESQRAGR